MNRSEGSSLARLCLVGVFGLLALGQALAAVYLISRDIGSSFLVVISCAVLSSLHLSCAVGLGSRRAWGWWLSLAWTSVLGAGVIVGDMLGAGLDSQTRFIALGQIGFFAALLGGVWMALDRESTRNECLGLRQQVLPHLRLVACGLIVVGLAMYVLGLFGYA